MKSNRFQNNSDKLPLTVAFGWLFLSTLLVSGSATMGLFYYWHMKSLRDNDSKYNIVTITQKSSGKGVLETSNLAELLNLSVDSPQNLYRFNANDAVEKLLASSLIKKAEVLKIKPNKLFIDYILRQPVAYLGDYSNTVIDTEGIPFPWEPYFKPENLPEIYIGFDQKESFQFQWGVPIKGKEIQLAMELLKFLIKFCCSPQFTINRIDVAHSYSPSYGQRQVVIILNYHKLSKINGRSEVDTLPHYLRVSAENFPQELANYLTLRPYLMQNHFHKNKESVTIDLRIPHLAFIK